MRINHPCRFQHVDYPSMPVPTCGFTHRLLWPFDFCGHNANQIRIIWPSAHLDVLEHPPVRFGRIWSSSFGEEVVDSRTHWSFIIILVFFSTNNTHTHTHIETGAIIHTHTLGIGITCTEKCWVKLTTHIHRLVTDESDRYSPVCWTAGLKTELDFVVSLCVRSTCAMPQKGQDKSRKEAEG